MIKFLADMGISQRTVAYLRETNFDAIHLREQGLQKLQDPIILQKAKAEDRILLTHHHTSLQISAFQPDHRIFPSVPVAAF